MTLPSASSASLYSTKWLRGCHGACSCPLRPPVRPEHAAGDGDGDGDSVGAREPHDPDRRRSATEGGDDGRDGSGGAAPASAAVVLARLVRVETSRRGRVLVAGEDEGVRARG